ncbi:DUF92-domain-containing protein [Ceraceosorus guamensis]|uniref:DUF92-domain-containing protein n=1 Tax=Ceraceosorus guamensis TaxID=1522189 RepID=A0A316W3F3_9BASI|nr:DUF92-domain-containing protein [Ceraceosorus guamensis]PWN44252.1 DUF92-domain-containing protein [Ceraceosorus guamensis]
MGDTLASELGILAKGQPRLVTTWKQVPRGTNGGVSALGTLVSFLGGALIGVVCIASLYFLPPSQTDDSLCSPSVSSAVIYLSVGALSGLGGSMVDSLLGATVQKSWYNRKLGKILIGRRPPGSTEGQWEVITGHDMLSNSAVNFISSAVTACAAAGLGSLLF